MSQLKKRKEQPHGAIRPRYEIDFERDVTLYGTPAQKAKVDAKVHAKFPNLGKKKSSLYSKD